MRTTRAPYNKWKGILRRTQSQTKRPARSTVPNHVARDSTETRPTQRPRSHTAPKVKGETNEGRECSLGICTWNEEKLYPGANKSHVLRCHVHIISPNGKRSNKTWTTYTSRTLHTDHSTNMVEEPKIDIGRKRMCAIISQVHDLSSTNTPLHPAVQANNNQHAMPHVWRPKKSAHDSAT